MELTEHDRQLVAEALYRNFSPQAVLDSGLLQREVDREYRLALAEVDPIFFSLFYIGHYFYEPFAPFHYDLFAEFLALLATPGRAGMLAEIARGFAKSTICTLAFPLWCALLKKRHFIVIFSDAKEQAFGQLSSIREELEQNERIKEDFGEQEGSTWAASQIVLKNGVRMDALGAGMKIRGRRRRQFRPDLMIFDDIENEKEVASETQRESRKKWFNGAAMRAGWRDTKVIVDGNMLSFNCLLADLEKNPIFRVHKHNALISWAEDQELWDKWAEVFNNLADSDREAHAREFYEAHREAMDEGAISAWPEAHPYYGLMVDRESEGHESFATEMMNNPLDPSKTLFHKFHMFRKEYRPHLTLRGVYDTWLVPGEGESHPAVPLEACTMFGFTDPAMGKSMKSDFSATIIGARAPSGVIFVIEADIKRRPPEQTIQAQIKWAQKYSPHRFGVESTAFQALFASDSNASALAAGVRMNLVEVPHHTDKHVRIQSLEPDITNGNVMLCAAGQELLLLQLQRYLPGIDGEKDDGPDALEGLRTLADMFPNTKSSSDTIEIDSHVFNNHGNPLGRVQNRDPYAELLETEDAEDMIFTPLTVLSSRY